MEVRDREEQHLSEYLALHFLSLSLWYFILGVSEEKCAHGHVGGW